MPPKPLFSHVLNLRKDVPTPGSITMGMLAPSASVAGHTSATMGGDVALSGTNQIVIEQTPTLAATRPVLILGCLRFEMKKLTTNTNGCGIGLRLHVGGVAVTDGTLLAVLDLASWMFPTANEGVSMLVPVVCPYVPGSAGPLRFKVWGNQSNPTDYTPTMRAAGSFLEVWQFA